MSVDELRAFLAVVDSGSLLAAADALKLSRATLRRRIEELEASAGTPLLCRTRRGATLTEAGAVIASQGRSIVKDIETMMSTVRDSASDPEGLLRVLVPPGLPPGLLTPLLVLLRSRYTRLTVRLVLGLHSPTALPDGVDVAIALSHQTPDGPWNCYELLRVRERLLAGREYLERAGTPKSIIDVVRHPLLAWDRPGTDPRLFPTLNGSSFGIDPVLVSSDVQVIRQCVLAGLGMALLPETDSADPAAEQQLIPVLPGVVGRECMLTLLVPPAVTRLPKIKAVIELCQALRPAPEARSGDRSRRPTSPRDCVARG